MADQGESQPEHLCSTRCVIDVPEVIAAVDKVLIKMELKHRYEFALWCAFAEACRVYREATLALAFTEDDKEHPEPGRTWFRMEQHGQQYAATRVIRHTADALKVKTMHCGASR